MMATLQEAVRRQSWGYVNGVIDELAEHISWRAGVMENVLADNDIPVPDLEEAL
jgi:hypothetical protein